MEKKKIYVLMLSEFLPKTHSKAGTPTGFKDKFTLGQSCPDCNETQDLSCEHISNCTGCMRTFLFPKLHTIRANYPLWGKRISDIQAGRAVLSVRQWTGKPYRSKQVEITTLTAEDGIGIQRLDIFDFMRPAKVDSRQLVDLTDLANNDGLSFSDWYHWFRLADVTKPMAVIHFTKFRY